MTLHAELYWSFRSPYSYLGTRQYRRIAEEHDLEIDVRIVYPLAIRKAGFFDTVNPLWIPYLIKDCMRIAEFRGLPFKFPSPDPVVQNLETMEIAKEQPYIHFISRLGVEAARRGRGLAFIDEVSKMIWGGTKDWDKEEQLGPAAQRAGLDLKEMQAAVSGNEKALEEGIASNQDAHEAAGHWGVPCFVFEGEPFFGQDRIDLAEWRMKQKGLAARTAPQS